MHLIGFCRHCRTCRTMITPNLDLQIIRRSQPAAQVGGGGHVEEALVDLTGGVAGRFYTADVWGPWGWGKGPQFPKRFMTGRRWLCWCQGLLLCLRLLYFRGEPELVWLQIWEFCGVYHHCCFKTTLLGGFKQVCLMYFNMYYDVICICVFCCSYFHPDVGKIGE